MRVRNDDRCGLSTWTTLSHSDRTWNSTRRLKHVCVVTYRIPFFKDSYFQAFDQGHFFKDSYFQAFDQACILLSGWNLYFIVLLKVPNPEHEPGNNVLYFRLLYFQKYKKTKISCIQGELASDQRKLFPEEYVLHRYYVCNPENLHCGTLLHSLSILWWLTALSQTLDTACLLRTPQSCGRIPNELPCW